ncbi:unnamed protein product [Coffea canephora]|uniref:Dicer-like protein 4 n=1 Tax=Coffea canephora TaxID=49390 RepID=A0A068UQI2_COFCA|nr:unnamed protein product [Coffea canephora]
MDGCQSTNVNASAAAVRNFAAPFVANGTAETTSVTTERFSSLSLGDDGGGFSVQPQDKPEKDPRKIARKYQLDLCQKALEENVIVYLGTGCGKTHIATLLIYEMGHLIKKPQKRICIFLAPTVALVQQQAKVIEDSIDFKVGIYCGNSKRLRSHQEWERELEEHEILVMTPQILLHNLSHCFIKIELIALLIFDECHYAQIESNHPYAEIMKIFYKSNVAELPRIFGMTASPILGKATTSSKNWFSASVDGLETLLRAKVYSVEDVDELEQFVASPKLRIYYYDPTIISSSCARISYHEQLEMIKHQCVSDLTRKTGDHNTLRITKKMLQRLHGNIMFSLENLGLWGSLQASCILSKGDHYEQNEGTDAEESSADNSLCDRYLTEAYSVLASACRKDDVAPDLSLVEFLKEPFFSRKLLRLIGILRTFRLQPNMKCIVFVNRIVTARSLSYILKNLKFLSSWKCHFLIGVHSGLKSMSRKTTNAILEKFRSGELNLLIATKVGEEGLDIQTCCLVIRFDLPETVASFIQSRGRARMPESEYAFLVNSGNEKEINLIKHFVKDELKMHQDISSRKSQVTMADFEEKTYQVDLTGATISSASSISLLHHYCSKLPHDEYFNPRPQFFYLDEADGMVCLIILPSNAPIHEIVSASQVSFEAAKKDACLKACKTLHEVGALTDYLLPEQDSGSEETDDNFSDTENCDDDDLRRELHEMLIPAALKETWTELKNSVSLCTYHFKFCPNPIDRLYREFALFVKSPLPKEAEKMKLDLHLDRGRSVLTELVPYGVVKFTKDELVQAEKFQRMFLKVILDRSEFTSEFVSLENKTGDPISSTSYLLLPILLNNNNKVSVDWKLVEKCLSSSIFGAPKCAGHDESSQDKRQLHLAKGIKSAEEVVNSLVYVPCKDTFFFVSDIVYYKNGYSSIKDSKNHLDLYMEKFSIQLCYPHQPLLKAKQVFCLDNLLRKKGYSGTEVREKEEHFIELPPEICQLKIVGFSKDIGSSLSLLPSIMHRLESLLVAIELKNKLSASFPQGAEVTVQHVLEALTTEKCSEHFSLERLEVLGDAFLKFAVGRRLFLLHNSLDEGQLTKKRSNIVNNSNLLNLAMRKNLQVYIRDQSFEPNQFFAVGRPCPVICSKQTENAIHSHASSVNDVNTEVRCSKCHHWLYKKTIADVVEALIGAFLVDSGFGGATAFLKWIGIQIDFEESQLLKIFNESKNFLPLANQINITALENLLGYKFRHKGLLIQAFVHPSYNNHLGGCYQRLEFLGDAMLDYLITSYLYSVYPKLKPGQLTDLRSASVNNTSFADIAIHCSFHEFIICDSSALSKSMEQYVSFTQTTERGQIDEPTCPKALGDLVESCMGAILLDTGFDLNCVWKIMLSLLNPTMSSSKLWINPIRDLQELCQCHGMDLQFSASRKSGIYTVQSKVTSGDLIMNDSATNISKKAAKRMAAKQLYSRLKDVGYTAKSKSLDEVLKETEKMEAQLIGFDEKPSVVNAKFDDFRVQEEASETENGLKVYPLNEDPGNDYNSSHKHIRQIVAPYNASRWRPTGATRSLICNPDSREAGGMSTGSPKSRLYEICATNYWGSPIFECLKENGPSHLKEYTFKVVVEIDDALNQVLECCGEPRPRKKDAEQSAAEGALWCLKHERYLWHQN